MPNQLSRTHDVANPPSCHSAGLTFTDCVSRSNVPPTYSARILGPALCPIPRHTFSSHSAELTLATSHVFPLPQRTPRAKTSGDSIRSVLCPATKAIVAVHLAGWPRKMDEIMDLASEYGLKITEDCARANGATYQRAPRWLAWQSCRIFLLPRKNHYPAGEGGSGMIAMNSDEIYQQTCGDIRIMARK